MEGRALADNDGFLRARSFFNLSNGGSLLLRDGSRFDGRTWETRSDVTGEGTCALVDASDIRVFWGTHVSGPVDLCDPRGPEIRGATLGPEVTQDCSCELADPFPADWSWTPAAAVDDPTSRTPTVTPSGSTTLTVHVDDGTSVIASAQVTVEEVTCSP